MKERNESLDCLKGIAILLVMFGHVQVHNHMTDPYLYDVIKYIQMPLFFLVSGYLAGKGTKIHLHCEAAAWSAASIRFHAKKACRKCAYIRAPIIWTHTHTESAYMPPALWRRKSINRCRAVIAAPT